ncbi:hypothetical protein [Planococcus rifietoensis]|uniref:hypothetical protein n=1 Tax=Planococcus rifietoensis TaxID=200991 RepID=UPI00384AE224
MFKKSIAAVIFSFIMILSMGTGAFASEIEVVDGVSYETINETMSPEVQKAIKDINKVNEKIEAEIAKNEEKAAKLYARYEAELEKETDLEKKAELTAKYEEQITKLITKLQEKAEKMTEKGIEKADKAGIETNIVLVEGFFGDRTALIDPIVVVSW